VVGLDAGADDYLVKPFAFAAQPPAGSGDCESCHGPRSKHVENPTGALAIGKDSPAQTAVCLQCHEGGARFGWKAGAHATSDVSCTSCHTVMSKQSPRALLTKATTTISGSVTAGVLQISNDTNSAKLTEYRDLRDKFYLPMVTFGALDASGGWGLEFSAANAAQNDQTILMRTGKPGVWTVQADWSGIPHNFSNKAVTPCINRGNGLFTLPAAIPITFKKLATSAADTAGVLASDDLHAAYQSTYLAPVALGTQTNAGRFGFTWDGLDALSLGFRYDLRDTSGSKSGFGPIGDRPPRTLNVQLAEPADYRTGDFTLSAEHQGRGYQLGAEFLFSSFANGVDTLKWQNMYTSAAPGADYDVWDRLVSVYGQRPLPPDNQYQNVTINGGIDMKGNSRLFGTVSIGQLDQNATLLPYAYGGSALANKTLPRSTASASMTTTHTAVDYVFSPMRTLSVRGYFRTAPTTSTPASGRRRPWPERVWRTRTPYRPATSSVCPKTGGCGTVSTCSTSRCQE
jgi:hypothetical protein